MKTLITTLALASLFATSAVAKSGVHSKHTKHVEPAYYNNVYELELLGTFNGFQIPIVYFQSLTITHDRITYGAMSPKRADGPPVGRTKRSSARSASRLQSVYFLALSSAFLNPSALRSSPLRSSAERSGRKTVMTPSRPTTLGSESVTPNARW